MASYDSDESLSDEERGTSTNVFLGYASKDPMDDTVSHLGGYPTWLDSKLTPSYSFSRCLSCCQPMALLLQLNTDLPERFPGHERRLYVWACRKKQCRRKPGAMRALRNVRANGELTDPSSRPIQPSNSNYTVFEHKQQQQKSEPNLGTRLFGGSGLGSDSGNPSWTPSSDETLSVGPSRSQHQDLSTSFAQKARIADSTSESLPHPGIPASAAQKPFELWPSQPETTVHPIFYLDAELEYLATNPTADPPTVRTAFLDTVENAAAEDGVVSSSALPDDRIDRAFQRFADTLAQNPEQVLRYDFGGRPLLYRHDDAVGQLLASHAGSAAGINARFRYLGASTGMPACPVCGAGRVLEVQLTPGLIAILEEDIDAARVLSEGMEWGTVIVGVCSADCAEEGVCAREEWVGVQWEEVVDRGNAAGGLKGKPGK